MGINFFLQILPVQWPQVLSKRIIHSLELMIRSRPKKFLVIKKNINSYFCVNSLYGSQRIAAIFG